MFYTFDPSMKSVLNQDDVTVMVIVTNQVQVTIKVFVANQVQVTIKVIVTNQVQVTIKVIVISQDHVNKIVHESPPCLWFSALLPKEALVLQDPLGASALSVLLRAPQVVQRIIEIQKFVNGFILTEGAKLGLCRAMASSNISASSSPRPSAKTSLVAEQVWQPASLVLFFKWHSELDRSIRSSAIRMKGKKWTQ
ncbi:hypothetical protein CDAR_510521 [Caerostris darwini]|uniref:Uncharacterized protein n=1 Tax=Caerostris darwini TaxID=1538125 RepID=A0AAV4UGV3_9ARAC|nr:hypothetical protein CDAR_510521 [Caerostris darwini]